MSFLVDTSVWSLALRRDAPEATPEVARLRRALAAGESIHTTGLVLQELLQGFHGPKDRAAIVERFSALPLLVPDRSDHVAAAEVRNLCRRRGIQLGTIDALLVQLCLRHDLALLARDRDFERAARWVDLRLWSDRAT